MSDVENHESKKGGAPNKGSLQAYCQNFTKEAIDKVVDVMRNSRNEALAFGAAKLLIDKAIPDMKAMELTGQDNGPVLIRIVNEDERNRTTDQELPEAAGDL